MQGPPLLFFTQCLLWATHVMSGRAVQRVSILLRASARTGPFLTPKADILPFVGHQVSYVAYRLKYDQAAFRADPWEECRELSIRPGCGLSARVATLRHPRTSTGQPSLGPSVIPAGALK